jgi:hypothetical protein
MKTSRARKTKKSLESILEIISSLISVKQLGQQSFNMRIISKSKASHYAGFTVYG